MQIAPISNKFTVWFIKTSLPPNKLTINGSTLEHPHKAQSPKAPKPHSQSNTMVMFFNWEKIWFIATDPELFMPVLKGRKPYPHVFFRGDPVQDKYIQVGVDTLQALDSHVSKFEEVETANTKMTRDVGVKMTQIFKDWEYEREDLYCIKLQDPYCDLDLIIWISYEQRDFIIVGVERGNPFVITNQFIHQSLVGGKPKLFNAKFNPTPDTVVARLKSAFKDICENRY